MKRADGACDSFTRAQAIRAALSGRRGPVAREWDPRMPLPAGAQLDRRRFLLGAAGGLITVYGATRLGLPDRALADGIAGATVAGSTNAPVLVSLFLQGGVDALTLLAPTEDPLYRKLRPTLAVAPGSGQPFREDPSLSWHPSAASLAALHNAGKVTVFPAIGYADPDLSHFTSRHYWEVGALDTRLQTGWMGRYLDVAGDGTNPLAGLSMDGQINPVLASARQPTSAIDQPDNFATWMNGLWGDAATGAFAAAAALGQAQAGSPDPAIAQVARAAADVGIVRNTLGPWTSATGKQSNPAAAYGGSVAYPMTGQGDLPARLAGLAAMIAAGVPLSCVALTTDTQFDTHSGEVQTFNSGIQLVSDSLAAFQADLEARGIADRVLVHVWSEFGRRAQQNGSNGTDHGAAGISMLIGTRVSGTMVGEFAPLNALDPNGNQVENTDFRALYCSLLEQWFNFDAGQVIAGASAFPRYTLLAPGTAVASPPATVTTPTLTVPGL